MLEVPLRERVVEVIADLGREADPRYRFGSGCRVAGQTVLTAAHVVAGAHAVSVRGVDKAEHPAEMGAVGDPGEPAIDLAPDLALLTVPGVTPVPALLLAAVDRDSAGGEPVARCLAVGYPEFAERSGSAGSVRDTVHTYGEIPVLSQLVSGLLTLQVSSSPRVLPPAGQLLAESPWSGMSGAPVIADGHLIGVVTEHAPRAGPSAITVTPLTALDHDPAHPEWGPGVSDAARWWALLGKPGRDASALPRLPRRRERRSAPYWATIREIHSLAGQLVGREAELASIVDFATGPPGYRWIVGESGAETTSLLAEAVTAALPSRVDVVVYFLSPLEADADSDRFVAAVVPQLAELLGEDPPPQLDRDQFRALWARAAAAAAAAGRDLLLVVDGLDQDLHPPGSPSIATLLPATLTGRAHVLVSSKPHPELPADIPANHPLCKVTLDRIKPFAGAAEQAAVGLQPGPVQVFFRTGRDDDDRLTRTSPLRAHDVQDDLDLQNEIMKLQWLCERLPLHILLECYRGVAGTGALLDGLTDAARIMNRLTDATTDTKNRLAVLEFAIWLEHQADTEALRHRVAAWSAVAAQRRSLAADDLVDLRATISEQVASRRTPDRMVIRLDDSYGPALRYGLTVVLHRGSGAVDPLVVANDDRVYPLGELRALVAGSVSAWARTCDPTELVIEFLAPLHVLGEPFDQWPADEGDGGGSTPLGVLYRVVVRDLQRAEEEPSDLWRRRWKLLQTSRRPGEARVLRWIPAAVAQMTGLRAELQDGDWACLAFERFSDDEMSRRFVAAGIDLGAPAILWVRSIGSGMGPPAELRRELSATPLPGLPTKLFALRRDAMRHDRPADHRGRSLALLWHDPDHQRPAAGPLIAPTVEDD